MRKCCVPGCGNMHNLHAVPYTKPARWKAWLSICPFFSKYSFKQLEYVKICNIHFLHFTETRRFTSDAIPSLNLPDQSKPEAVLCSTTKKYLEITPSIHVQPHNINVVEFPSTGKIAPTFTATNEVPLLTSKSTLSVSNEPVFELSDSFYEEEICSPNLSNNMPLNIPSEQSSTFTNVVAHKPIHNEPVLEPTVNIIQYSQTLSPDPIKPSVGYQMSIDSYHEKIHTQPVVELPAEASQSLSSNPSTSMPSNVESQFVQLETTPVKIRSSRHIHSHRDVIPRVCLNKNEDSPRKRILRQGNKILREKLKSLTQKYNRLESKYNRLKSKYIRLKSKNNNIIIILVD